MTEYSAPNHSAEFWESNVNSIPKIETLQANVDLVTLGEKKLYLVGTAHVSQASADLAEEIIRSVNPDAIAVELCESRYKSLRDPERWRNTDIFSVIKDGKAYVLMAQLILAGFQRKIGQALNIKPGAEMLRSLEVADELKISTVLADREIRTTLKRTWASLSLWSMTKVIASLIASLFTKHNLSTEEIERLKSSIALEEMMKEISDSVPEVKDALIDERDQYLAAKIRSAAGNTVVAIVGAGHIPGIKRYLDKPVDLQLLEQVPGPTVLRKVLAWLVPGLLIGMILYGFVVSGAKASIEMATAWIAATSLFSTLGALIALPHPLTLLSAALAAPIMSIHPFIATGWVSGLVEAFLRKPRVSDLDSISDDMTTIRGIWRNRVSRILLVIAFTNLGAMIGMAVGIPLVASKL